MTGPASLVPQADPGAAYRAQSAAIDEAVERVLRSGTYILGSEGAAFESEFAAWIGGGHAVACASGTDALCLALQACGVGPGMAVATVSHTAVATVAAIVQAGATPILLDVEAGGYTMDAEELAEVLSYPPPSKAPIRAVLPVHLYGEPADMDAITAITRRHGARLIEDCSQAHGATIDRQRVGLLGDAATFSFYPTKNLAALGDGGLVLTPDPAVAVRVRRLRQYGWDEDRVSWEAGWNSRLDELQAAILRVRLSCIDAANLRRNAIAARYDAALADTGTPAPRRRTGCTHVFHQYVIETSSRTDMRARLLAAGIATAVHYARPVHRHPAYEGRVALGPRGCRRTDAVAAAVVSLPIYPELTDAQVDVVCAALRTL